MFDKNQPQGLYSLVPENALQTGHVCITSLPMNTIKTKLQSSQQHGMQAQGKKHITATTTIVHIPDPPSSLNYFNQYEYFFYNIVKKLPLSQ